MITYDISDLPELMQKAITKLIQKYPEIATRDGSKGRCVKISDELLIEMDEINMYNCNCHCEKLSECSHLVNGDVVGNGDPIMPHHWVWVDGWNIDLTARQFDENDLFPKIWRNDE